jgi:ribonuclease HI
MYCGVHVGAPGLLLQPGVTCIMLIRLEGDMLKYAIQFDFLATNNIAKYEGLVIGLRLAKELGIR